MLAVCTVFSVYSDPVSALVHAKTKRVWKQCRARIVYSKKGGAFEAAYFWSMNTPSVDQEIPFYWHEMVTMPLLCCFHVTVRGGGRYCNSIFHFNDETLVLLVFLAETS